MQSLSTMTWRDFRTALSKPRSARGGNHAFTYLNMQSKAVKGKFAKAAFNAQRRAWRETYPVAPAHVKKVVAKRFLEAKRTRKAEKVAFANLQDTLSEMAKSKGRAASDAATHFGMGSTLFPISPANLEMCMRELGHKFGAGRRGGLRKLASHLMRESDFVYDGQGKTLQPSRRDSCCTKHPGLCLFFIKAVRERPRNRERESERGEERESEREREKPNRILSHKGCIPDGFLQ